MCVHVIVMRNTELTSYAYLFGHNTHELTSYAYLFFFFWNNNKREIIDNNGSSTSMRTFLAILFAILSADILK